MSAPVHSFLARLNRELVAVAALTTQLVQGNDAAEAPVAALSRPLSVPASRNATPGPSGPRNATPGPSHSVASTSSSHSRRDTPLRRTPRRHHPYVRPQVLPAVPTPLRRHADDSSSPMTPQLVVNAAAHPTGRMVTGEYLEDSGDRYSAAAFHRLVSATQLHSYAVQAWREAEQAAHQTAQLVRQAREAAEDLAHTVVEAHIGHRAQRGHPPLDRLFRSLPIPPVPLVVPHAPPPSRSPSYHPGTLSPDPQPHRARSYSPDQAEEQPEDEPMEEEAELGYPDDDDAEGSDEEEENVEPEPVDDGIHPIVSGAWISSEMVELQLRSGHLTLNEAEDHAALNGWSVYQDPDGVYHVGIDVDFVDNMGFVHED